MTGLLLFRATQTKYPQHVHVRMSFTGGRESELRYWNPRRFGVDPLTVTCDDFISLMEARRGRLKPLLMHQQVIAGIVARGNCLRWIKRQGFLCTGWHRRPL
jgi:formamidopyrimidine-DNA glycosylase